MKRKKQRGGSYGGRKSARPPKVDPRQQEMVEEVVLMGQNLACPIALASDHAERCHRYSEDAATMGKVALFARDLYRAPKGETPAVNLGPVLEDFAAAMERFSRELAEFAARFDAFDDHDVEHDHLDPGSIDHKALLDAMFGLVDDDPTDDDKPGA